MKDWICKYFQVGILQRMSHPVTRYEALDSIRTITYDEYFDAIEVCPFSDEETRAMAKKYLHDLI